MQDGTAATAEMDLRTLIHTHVLGLTPYETRVADLWLDGRTEREILLTLHEEDLAGGFVKPSERRRLRIDGQRRVRWALDRIAERVAIHQPVFAAGHEFARCVVDCVRNRKDFRAPQPLVGILPLTDLRDDRLKDPEQARKLHRNVPLRGKIMFPKMVEQSGADSLRHLAAGLG